MLLDTIKDAGGKIATKLLQAEVRDAGHSWDAAKRLKKSLGIESVKMSMGGAWFWCLSASGTQREREEHTQNTSLPSLPSHPSLLSSSPVGSIGATTLPAPEFPDSMLTEDL